jgi:hypothetical protein
MCQTDSFKINTCANNAGIGNKLVTIFAPHLDNFILTLNFSLIYQIRDFGSGHPDSYRDLQPRQFYRSPGLAKIAPWWLAAGTVSRLKYRMTHRRAAPPTLTAHTSGPLAFIFKALLDNFIIT